MYSSDPEKIQNDSEMLTNKLNSLLMRWSLFTHKDTKGDVACCKCKLGFYQTGILKIFTFMFRKDVGIVRCN